MQREIYKIQSTNERLALGARMRNAIGNVNLPDLDPFILLDEFIGEGSSGFPDHPHRKFCIYIYVFCRRNLNLNFHFKGGFEAISYVIEGNFYHEDFKGNKGFLRAGDVQWLTIGRGIVHSETPKYDETNRVRALQLWINLAKKNKMIEPIFQHLAEQNMPKKSLNGVHVKIISGESMDIKSNFKSINPIYFLDFKLDKNASFTQQIPNDLNAFIYVLNGCGIFGYKNEMKAYSHEIIVFTNEGDSISFRNDKDKQLHFILLAGRPLNEIAVKGGSFVMNSHEEINQARHDYLYSRNGFENASNWFSDETKNNKFNY
jgi:quercetin 2,3-dioxygenase